MTTLAEVDAWMKEFLSHDYSVTWNQVKSVVDKLIDDHDKRMAMGDIEHEVHNAWAILYHDLKEYYGD